MLRHRTVIHATVAALFASLVAPTIGETAVLAVDRLDDDPTAIGCLAAVANDCSLRGAVRAANAEPGADTILVPAGTYHLTAGAGTGAAQGDLELEGDTTIVGAGRDLTVLEGASIGDHFFTVEATTSISDMTLVGAHSADFGGAVEVNFGASLTMERVAIVDNESDLAGGGIVVGGALTLRDALVLGNVSQGSGGGITAALASTVLIEDSAIRSNATLGSGGGVAALDASEVELVRSFVGGNSTGLVASRGAATPGGGLHVGADATMILEDTEVWSNIAPLAAGIDVRGYLTMRRSTVAWNRGTTAAGVRVAGGGVAALRNSTLSHNGVGSQKVDTLVVVGGGLVLDHVTIVPLGTGLAVRGQASAMDGGADIEIKGSAVDGRCDFDATSTALSEGRNVSLLLPCWTVDDPGMTDDVVGDLALASLFDWGGPTRTHLPMVGSPLLDHSGGAFCPVSDQRSLDRTDCDAGAVERRPSDPDPVFADDFESGGVGAWSSATGTGED